MRKGGEQGRHRRDDLVLEVLAVECGSRVILTKFGRRAEPPSYVYKCLCVRVRVRESVGGVGEWGLVVVVMFMVMVCVAGWIQSKVVSYGGRGGGLGNGGGGGGGDDGGGDGMTQRDLVGLRHS